MNTHFGTGTLRVLPSTMGFRPRLVSRMAFSTAVTTCSWDGRKSGGPMSLLLRKPMCVDILAHLGVMHIHEEGLWIFDGHLGEVAERHTGGVHIHDDRVEHCCPIQIEFTHLFNNHNLQPFACATTRFTTPTKAILPHLDSPFPFAYWPAPF